MSQQSSKYRNMLESIAKKGGLEILISLKSSPKKWGELEKTVKEKKSVSYRLREFLNLGLIQITIIRDTPTGSKAYELTPLGKKIVKHIEEMEKEFERYHKGLSKGRKFIEEVMEEE
ncbi:transcriptional regulator [Archaeoglobales archaeon]|nr:MAG: transcriptional regulator [Archaeoglobales archaeon]